MVCDDDPQELKAYGREKAAGLAKAASEELKNPK